MGQLLSMYNPQLFSYYKTKTCSETLLFSEYSALDNKSENR